jgi:ATP/maltotriose-dependent transcriptional regulator MalT
MLVVEGPAGIGKSSLLAEARVMAGRMGVRALFGDASESREAVPFAPLLDATLRSDPPIGERESARLLSEQPYWMVHELQGALEAAALERPLVLVLDDLHWADSGTLGALTALPARLVGSPILWILATRGHEGRARVRESMARLERGGCGTCAWSVGGGGGGFGRPVFVG